MLHQYYVNTDAKNKVPAIKKKKKKYFANFIDSWQYLARFTFLVLNFITYYNFPWYKKWAAKSFNLHLDVASQT